ncbi:hypothetical protein QBC43DRAFT_290354 [Cladorrhinum sp. PSN259]|nr:hypothetical protein QBC43DRAFT_290354 [Cladorrhinum sp. PSN259]
MSAMWGAMEGYGELSDEMAFRVAIDADVRLVGCYNNRRSRTGSLMAPREVIVAGLTIGRDLILNEWAKERKLFGNSALASLFITKYEDEADPRGAKISGVVTRVPPATMIPRGHICKI